MAVFGNIFGPVYPLGLVAPSVPGTPAALSQNVPTNETGIGTVEMNANQLICKAPSSNTGLVYLCFRGGSKAIPNSIIMDLTAGQAVTLGSSAGNSPYRPKDLVVDADVASEGMRITCIIGS